MRMMKKRTMTMNKSDMKSLTEIEMEHTVWSSHNFPSSNSDKAFKGMVEELGELSHAILKQEQGIRGSSDYHELEAKDAVGDLLIYTIEFCNKRGWRLYDILNETWESVRQRDWIKFPFNGLTE